MGLAVSGCNRVKARGDTKIALQPTLPPTEKHKTPRSSCLLHQRLLEQCSLQLQPASAVAYVPIPGRWQVAAVLGDHALVSTQTFMKQRICFTSGAAEAMFALAACELATVAHLIAHPIS